jgi:hypothetical protein
MSSLIKIFSFVAEVQLIIKLN